MRNVGIIGGLAPQSTTLFYAEIIRQCQMREEVAYPNILINSIKLWDVVSLLDDKPALIKLLHDEIEKIQHHVDFIAIPCNTIHCIIQEIRHISTVPVLAIHEEVCREISVSGVRKVGILGTKATVYNQFYQQELCRLGIDHATLCDDDERELNSMIFEKMLYGKNSAEMQKLLKKDIHLLEEQECDAVILACTELPLFISQKEVSVKLFASTHILAASVVQRIFTEG